MSKDVAPRSSNNPAKRTGGEVTTSQGRSGEISTRSSGQLRYSPTDLVGFDHVPAEVVNQLHRENTIAGSEIAAWAEPPVTKRRADGSFYQVVSAWWADETRLVVFDVMRDLEQMGKGQFRPAGAWAPQGTVYQFPSGVSAVTYSSTPEEAVSAKHGKGGANEIAKDPLDVLPEYLQSPVRGGTAGACLQTGHKWVRETIVAQKVGGGRAHVLRAQRDASSKRSLPQSTWTITSIDVPVHGSRQLGSPQRRSASVEARRQQAPSIEAPRTYW